MVLKQMSRTLVLAALALSALGVIAQGTRADYQRALGLQEKYRATVVNQPDQARWVGKTHRFVYRKSLKDGHEWVMVDAKTQTRSAPFDHARLAATLKDGGHASATAISLPFSSFQFVKDESAIEFWARQETGWIKWTCTLSDYQCTKDDSPEPLPADILRGSGNNGPNRGPHDSPDMTPVRSPDGKWEAFIKNYNIAVRPTTGGAPIVLGTDGSEGDAYELESVVWSPDSRRLVAYRVKPGYQRYVHYVESSPEDQLQPKHWRMQYVKPGDVLDRELLVLFQIDPVKRTEISRDLTPNPYEFGRPVWRKDSSAFTFEYNQRGHQVYRVLDVDAESGNVRPIISEETATFYYYNWSSESRNSGKYYRHDVDDGREVIWMSERDGWNHLYLIDGTTGNVKNQITKGAWPVRNVQKVDEEKRQIWFSAGGMKSGRDPYFLNYYRIDFDGSGLVAVTDSDADHRVSYSDDMEYFVDTYSRVDLPTVLDLRRTSDRSLIATIEQTDVTELKKRGWKAPEVFTAKGRDGVTDIWGLIFRPSNFDPSRKYPVIENIYAGPHGSHVPKNFAAYHQSQAQAEVGFIVVHIDGMGTSNRSKAFHDVAWKNLADAGFPDRILWHKAVAAKYPSYDISRVGIFGFSAGAQNAMAALLFHPDFYKAAVAYAGCHDNRMDKIWWNEQWMGWPIGPQYDASSNVVNAHRLQGKLLLLVGELDSNVDPASTMQVVAALIKARKTFDLMVSPGEEHPALLFGKNQEYGDRVRYDFFARHLLGVQPPNWNAHPPVSTKPAAP